MVLLVDESFGWKTSFDLPCPWELISASDTGTGMKESQKKDNLRKYNTERKR